MFFSIQVWLWGCRRGIGWDTDLTSNAVFIGECEIIEKGTRVFLRLTWKSAYNGPWTLSWVSKKNEITREWGQWKRGWWTAGCEELKSYSWCTGGSELETRKVLAKEPRSTSGLTSERLTASQELRCSWNDGEWPCALCWPIRWSVTCESDGMKVTGEVFLGRGKGARSRSSTEPHPPHLLGSTVRAVVEATAAALGGL